MGLPFVLPSQLRALVWTLSVGTPLTGFGVDKLVDAAPDSPLWLGGTSIDARSDQGSALRLDGLVLVHHNFAAGTTLRVQMHSDTATWGGTTDVDLSVDVGPWLGRFAPHVFFHIAAAHSLSLRTKRYIRFTNTDANNVNIQIGEIVPLVTLSDLASAGLLIEPTPQAPLTYGRSLAEGKKGPQYMHDRRTRDRRWSGQLLLVDADAAALKAWQDDSYGVRPFVVWPLGAVTDEPIYARFESATRAIAVREVDTRDLIDVPVEFRELSCGEAY